MSQCFSKGKHVCKFLIAGIVLIGSVNTFAEETKEADEPDPNALAKIDEFPADVEIFANRAGFCIDLGCGQGKLAAEIASKTHYTVFAIAKDDSDCAAARQLLDKNNLYGARATVVTGSLKKIPLPNGYGNLIVTGDFQETLDLKEVVRVLNPNGIAVIGGGNTDPVVLKAALESAQIKNYRISGRFAIFRGKLPDGIDEWTHFAHGPESIHTSRETVVRPPFRTQWLLGDPAYDDKASNHAAIANGRIVFRASGEKPNPDRYYGFDAFNGALLWQRPVAKAHNNYRYALVDDVFYSTESDTVVGLDAVTGAKKKEYSVPKTYWYWIAVNNGALYALGKSAEVPATANVLGASNLCCAFNLKTDQMIWKHEFKTSVIMQSAALNEKGELCVCTIDAADPNGKTANGSAVVLDPKTGEERWHSDVGKVAVRYGDCTAAGCFEGKYFVWCWVDEKGVQGVKAFDVSNGQLVKEFPGVRSWGEGFVDQVLFTGRRMYCNTIPGREPYRCTDLLSGEQAQNNNQTPAGDHPGTASANCLYSGGEGFRVYDLETGKTWSDPSIRFGDFSAPYIAEGMLFHMPTVCHCPHAFGGPEALVPAGQNWTPPAADKEIESRLIKGAAYAAPLAEDANAEWTHYRGNPGHTGQTASAPKLPLKSGWEAKLGGKLTPPSFGSGLVFTASHSGYVWALDQATGAVRWKFICGASVRVTPAYGRGRVLFGSDDGWVYCLEATTGQLAWRFRAAPEDYYIHTEGQMNSIWPSAAGVLLEGTTVYCAAGLQSFDGTYLYALDLQTGKNLWARRIGDSEQQGDPQGIMALSDTAVIVPVFQHRGTHAYLKTDGAPVPWYANPRAFWTFGSEAITDGDVFFYGGPRHGDDDHHSRPAAFILMDSKTGWLYGPEKLKPEPLADVCIVPVLGKQTIVGDGAIYDRAKYQDALQKDPTKWRESKIYSLPLWKSKAQQTSGLALAGDIVTASGSSEIVVFDAKADGKELGRVEVGGKILRNTLAVANGRVFIVTHDGRIWASE